MPNTHTTTPDNFSDALKIMASIFGEALGEIAAKDAGAHITPQNPNVVNISCTRQKYTESMEKIAKADRLQETVNKMHKDLTAERNRNASFAGTIAANEKTIKRMQEEIERLKMTEPMSVPVIIVDSVAYDEHQIRELLTKNDTTRTLLVDGQLYTGDRIREMVAAAAAQKDYRTAMVQNESKWRKRAADMESTIRTKDNQIISLNSDLSHERNLRQHYQADTARLGRELAALKRKMVENRGCDINKMRKDLTAERGRNRSYETTIGELRFKVQDLEAKIAAIAPAAADADHYTAIINGKPYTRAELEALVKTPANVISVDGVTYSADDIRKVVDTSCQRAETINQLIAQRNSAMQTSAERADTIAGLAKQRDDAIKSAQELANRVHVYTYQGHDLTHEEVKKYINLGIAAEKAGLTVGYMNALNTVPAKAPGAPTTVIVENPDQDFVRLKYPDRTLDLAAKLIPQMVDDVNQLRTQVNNYDEREKRITLRNKQQASSLQAAEAEIEKLRKQVDDLAKERAEDSKTIHQLKIERNLLRGRLNESKPAVINGQTLKAGEAYMTTSLGLLPINSSGMRQLSDALDSYRARVQKLTNGLREWIKE